MTRRHYLPLVVASGLLFLLAWLLPHTGPFFHWLFPALDRPVYEQDSFIQLLISHLLIVGFSSCVSVGVGVVVAIWVTREGGTRFRPLIQSAVAMGQTIPPVAVLAIAAPLIGFGTIPALIALSLYGLLPIVESGIASFCTINPDIQLSAKAVGMGAWRRLWAIEIPLALPVLIAGIRTSVIINVGTAAIASTVGAKSLGSPIIVGLSGFNNAYVLQGAILVGGLAIVIDQSFGLILQYTQRWQPRSAYQK